MEPLLTGLSLASLLSASNSEVISQSHLRLELYIGLRNVGLLCSIGLTYALMSFEMVLQRPTHRIAC